MSNLIKSSHYKPMNEPAALDLARHYHVPVEEQSEEEVPKGVDPAVAVTLAEAERMKDEMLKDSQEFAERQLREASEEAERMLAEAKEQIDAWWEERRLQDNDLSEALKSEGYRQGYEEGAAKAEQEMRELLDKATHEAQELLQQAYRAKEELIQEAEPFLVELSCAIAEKVIERQLTVEPELMVELIRKNLSRKREKGVISLCVAPEHFEFIYAAREELGLVIDSQAELQILPDATVQDRGCVIRSSFGSVDARIDTQLEEIKKELVRIALEDEERRNQDEDA
ncbi:MULTISPECIES: FliH/SctL family protein [Paenibacillus]|uniref:Flagellar assembly protein FliH n=1 Tax=Paenibacillus campinasensis TaxID=66347 RepID=A0A268ES84_9BACL|nr:MULTISPECIES: FliH/SctL family protein [Paenibacillus]PAD75983.1 flagellar assembly protein FliH [Paenibacillus campinasensis]PAK54615.1 flagellar assembly protein FliH [Paenibacillus sp. 7541]